jgi:ABC-type antimicrobial peptide transport system permease subunit
MIKHYLTVAFRNLWKYKLQNIVGITGLSVGFLCFSICLFEIEWKTGYDTEYPGAKRMYYLLSHNPYSEFKGNIYNLMQSFPEVEKITAIVNLGGSVDRFTQAYRSSPVDSVKFKYRNFVFHECDTAFIGFFSLKIIAGDRHSIHHTVNSIVLFESTAKKLDKNIQSLIGKTIRDGNNHFRITGIVKKPVNSHITEGADGFIINKENGYLQQEIYQRWNPSATLIIMLNNKASVSDFKDRLNIRAKDAEFTLDPLNDQLKQLSGTYYLGKFLMGLLILLTTLFNYVSFQTAQFYNRLKECALRRTAGASKKHLFYLFFTEIIIAFVITYLISVLALDIFGDYLIFSYIFNAGILKLQMLKYLLFVLFLAFLLYLIPINAIHKMSIRTVFMGISQKGKKGIGRTFILFFQLVVLLLFLSSFMIVALQMDNYKSRIFNHLSEDDKKHIVYTYCFDERLTRNIDIIRREISLSPGVVDVAVNNGMATIGGETVYNDSIEIPGYYSNYIKAKPVHPDFFKVFRCVLLEGEFFTGESSPNDVIIDEYFASYYKNESPVGKSFNGHKIAGVIKNLNTDKTVDKNYTYDDRDIGKKVPVYYFFDPDLRKNNLVLYVKTHKGKVKEVKKVIRETFKKFIPPNSEEFSFTFDIEIENCLWPESILFRQMRILFIVSLIICLLGIYSAIVMNTEKRRKEIALRKINGATIKDIILLFSKTYLGLWTIACIAFCPVVYYFGNKWLENYLDRISLNIVFFVAIYFIILILVILTIIFQILKVARCNPAEVIKKE